MQIRDYCEKTMITQPNVGGAAQGFLQEASRSSQRETESKVGKGSPLSLKMQDRETRGPQRGLVREELA